MSTPKTMKITFIILGFLGLTAGLTGCNNKSTDDKLEAALKYAGTNRPELEKVLQHYSRSEEDSLKLKAAIFLISNMPGHYGPDSASFQAYKTRVDSCVTNDVHRRIAYTLPWTHPELCPGLKPAEDIYRIQADFLINQIEWAFRLKAKGYPWLKNIDFDVFCESILPYRVDYEPLEAIPDLTDTVLLANINYAIFHYEDCQHSNESMGRHMRYQEEFLPSYDISDTEIRRHLMVEKTNDIIYFQYRRIGIPATKDFIAAPHPDSRPTSSISIIDPRIYTRDVNEWNDQNIGKVYRHTYSMQEFPNPASAEFIPDFFRLPFHKDVTDLYLHTVDPEIHLSTQPTTEYAYACIFGTNQWEPVDYCRIESRKCRFTHLGCNCVYLPVNYPQGEMNALTAPFVIRPNRQIEYLSTHPDSTHTIRLDRLRPFLIKDNFYTAYLHEARIECADNPEFKNADTVGCFNEFPSYKDIHLALKPVSPHRYWRLIGASYQLVMPELHFLDQNNRQPIGKYIGNDTTRVTFLTDHKITTTKVIRGWIGLDFEKPVSIRTVFCQISRDEYNILPDKEYELFYYQQGKWNSTGIRKAEGHEVEFTEVPAHSLYRIVGKTSPLEGRIFTWEKGRPRWW